MKRQQENDARMIMPVQAEVPNFILVDKTAHLLYQKYREMQAQHKEENQSISGDRCWIIDNQTGQIICE